MAQPANCVEKLKINRSLKVCMYVRIMCCLVLKREVLVPVGLVEKAR